ncbi:MULTISPECIES: GerAB/ArcD/ProY family transporter [unclassified Paenibacillus]|nr:MULTISPECIES: GerAB/ArcD/ProY family transporter [unclassified Paenibacillus]AWP26518.1 spore gernimation protein [Paenibacillus sp. Cedars]MDH6669938.1 spore germination protein KB [Paenibacillus sp. LBL]
MEKVRISPLQFFSLLVLFQFGTTLVVNLGLQAGKDSWIAMLIGMIMGLLLFSMNAFLYSLFPDKLPTVYYRILLGKYLGGFVGLSYGVFYLHTASRDVVDGGLLVMASAALKETPLLIVNLIMVMTVAYVLGKGIEVLARTALIFLAVVLIIGGFSLLVILFAGIVDLQRLLPVMGEGTGPILESVVEKNIHFPFAELIVATVLMPALNQKKTGIKAGYLAILFCGVMLAQTSAITISVLGTNITERSVFPLLTMVGKANISEFIERTEILVVMVLIIGVFFKISLYYYAALMCTSELFKIPYKKLIYPYAVIILGNSMVLSRSYSEHLMKGSKYLYTVLPVFTIVIPAVLVILGMIRILVRRMKSKSRSKSEPNSNSSPAS